MIENGTPILGVVFAPALELCYSAKLNKGAFLNGKKIFNDSKRPSLIAATSSKHGNDETSDFLKKAKIADVRPYGSSLKLCKLAEGEIDIYPRLGTTCEWDIAAGHIIATEGGTKIIDLVTKEPLKYNKENLENNHFIAYRSDLDIKKFYDFKI